MVECGGDLASAAAVHIVSSKHGNQKISSSEGSTILRRCLVFLLDGCKNAGGEDDSETEQSAVLAAVLVGRHRSIIDSRLLGVAPGRTCLFSTAVSFTARGRCRLGRRPSAITIVTR